MTISIDDLPSSSVATISNSRSGFFGTDVAVAIGDVNGDGFGDFATTDRNVRVEVYNQATFSYDYGYGGVYVIFGGPGGAASPGADIDIGSLDGSDGFVASAIGAGGGYGEILLSAAGDVNGDGFDDLFIADRSGEQFSVEGEYGTYFYQETTLYVLFGDDTGFDAVFDLASLDPADGFEIDGPQSPEFGAAIDGGADFNGDGVADLLYVDPTEGAYGEAYVFFGEDNAVIDPALSDGLTIEGSADFRITDAAALVEDVNGDGIADLLLGDADAGTDPVYYANSAGAAFVLFGAIDPVGGTLSLADVAPAEGLMISAIGDDDGLGEAVAAIGDVNGDGLTDFIVTAPNADAVRSYDQAGAAYVVFGSDSGLPTDLNVGDLDGSNGFVITGDLAFRNLGATAASIGDVNADGFDDFALSATRSFNGGDQNAVYLLFGDAAPSANLDLAELTRSQGLAIVDDREIEAMGVDDVNGDG
ncbi:MAG: integrin alpha, partial [Pseudomonadota bacterium]